LYFADQGQDGYVSLPSGLITYFNSAEYDSAFGYDVVLGPNQTSGFLDGIMLDKNGNPEGLETLNYREAFDASWVYGAVISPDGTLLYQPGTNAIDVFDARTGAFQERVSISQTLSSTYRALVGDTKDNVLVAITGSGNGIAVVDLTALPAAPALPYVAISPEESRLGSSHSSATRSSVETLDAQHRSSVRMHSFYRQGLVSSVVPAVKKPAAQ
jgi:WD40 repeat protein